MRVYFETISDQTPLGVFSNLFNADDRETCRGWYVCVHVGPYRLSCFGRTR